MRKVDLLYTGGTAGMVPRNGTLVPLQQDDWRGALPEIGPKCEVYWETTEKLEDSSNFTPATWVHYAEHIAERYHDFDAFVLLHGTDTMAYTASALSFMLQHLDKPVILTGAQLPMDRSRTDARHNLLTALEIAVHTQYHVPEVCIYFGNTLMRGNRTVKYSNESFTPFAAHNYPPLAQAGIHLEFFPARVLPKPTNAFRVDTRLDNHVALLKYYPGMPISCVRALLTVEGLRGCVIETFGTGNLPEDPELMLELRRAVERGIVLVNVTQCGIGRVEPDRYQTGLHVAQAGIVPGADMTTEAALTKLMCLLGRYPSSPVTVATLMAQNLVGELSA